MLIHILLCTSVLKLQQKHILGFIIYHVIYSVYKRDTLIFTLELSKAGVYVRKNPAPASSGGGSTGGGRMNVADAQQRLTDVLNDAGQDVDAGIISKLTGKAAVYFATIIENIKTD